MNKLLNEDRVQLEKDASEAKSTIEEAFDHLVCAKVWTTVVEALSKEELNEFQNWISYGGEDVVERLCYDEFRLIYEKEAREAATSIINTYLKSKDK